MSPRLLLASIAVALLAGPLAIGCADAAPDDGAASTESAFTVDKGDRFVVSATPTRIVLRKRAGSVAFPFDERSLAGKAVLIHPVEKRGTDGVYARAERVTSDGDVLVVDSVPLTFAEMEAITEDEVVRIFVDSRAKLQTAPQGVRPLGWGGVGFNGLDFTTYVGLARPALLSPGVTVTHDIMRAKLEPDALVDYTRESGLELGLRATLDWKSKLLVTGRIGDTFYKSTPIDSPPLYVTVPIGGIPVPVRLDATAYIACSAIVVGPAEVSVEVSAAATLGGSVRIRPSADAAPSEWFTQGRWAPQADGKASAVPGIRGVTEGSIACALPRIELRARVAGVSGPFLAISPTVATSPTGVTFTATVGAGVEAELFGAKRAAEVTLVTWEPMR